VKTSSDFKLVKSNIFIIYKRSENSGKICLKILLERRFRTIPLTLDSLECEKMYTHPFEGRLNAPWSSGRHASDFVLAGFCDCHGCSMLFMESLHRRSRSVMVSFYILKFLKSNVILNHSGTFCYPRMHPLSLFC
jgi:hypothetical protein